MPYATVILPVAHKNVDKTFTYSIPQGLQITLGMAVLVPFGRGNKQYEAYVVGFAETCDFPTKGIIGIAAKEPLLTQHMIELALWMKDKYYTTMTQCLDVMLPRQFIKTAPKKQTFVSLVMGEAKGKNDAQQRVIDYLAKTGEVEQSHLIKALNISTSPINTLKKMGVVQIYHKATERNPIRNQNQKDYVNVLNFEQTQVLEGCLAHYDQKNSKPILIHGVTGSGKTEVYMGIIHRILQDGKQAIVLVPEISLTPQTVARFVARFGSLVNFTHSRLSAGERSDQWQNARNGNISIMIGPRSAIFAPFDNLGAIIVDEEHESSYKSETTPKYDAREIAIERGRLAEAMVVFGTATPSINAYYQTQKDQYKYFALENRVNLLPPKINIIDMRVELRSGNMSIFSEPLQRAIEKNLQTGLQTILFLNRRGHSTFVSCRNCGHVMKCTDCAVNYTYHRAIEQLMCHYCGLQELPPTNCPICGSKFIRHFGVGTQRIEKEIKEMYPAARLLRMDLDTTTKKHSHEDILTMFREQKADILIGTQMIAKGLDFPQVTVVGIVAADISLNAGDYRSAETTFQLLTQVAGRAGRAKDMGHVYIQTYTPEHYSIVHTESGSYQGFYEQEIALRRQMFYPPFSHVFLLLFTGPVEKDIIKMLFKLLHTMKYYNEKRPIFEFLGPAPAIISKIKNRYRWKLIVKSEDETKLKNFVLFTLEKFRLQNEQNELKEISVNLTLNPSNIV
ncbi:MAG: primosomal protein N' [Defluviitaleaceae bacterium]|nr:primosomal protein N' [Defluviitaleaceae bacterium]